MLERKGADAVTTRAVCAIAGVKSPTLYFHFVDKNGLLDAILQKGVAAFLKREKTSRADDDPLLDLASSWKRFLAFAVERPKLFGLIARRAEDNPEVLRTVFPRGDARLAGLAAQGRLTLDVASARLALLALLGGLALARRQGTSKKQVTAVWSALLDGTLNALVRANPKDN